MERLQIFAWHIAMCLLSRQRSKEGGAAATEQHGLDGQIKRHVLLLPT